MYVLANFVVFCNITLSITTISHFLQYFMLVSSKYFIVCITWRWPNWPKHVKSTKSLIKKKVFVMTDSLLQCTSNYYYDLTYIHVWCASVSILNQTVRGPGGLKSVTTLEYNSKSSKFHPISYICLHTFLFKTEIFTSTNINLWEHDEYQSDRPTAQIPCQTVRVICMIAQTLQVRQFNIISLVCHKSRSVLNLVCC